ncbi:TPR-like protein, partial [Polychaeton citri CBS 116435]
MDVFLRNWRDDALSKRQYDSAIFIGDKLLALTKSDQDTIVLAQTHFDAGNYSRALSYIVDNESQQGLALRNPQAKYLASYCYVKLHHHSDALNLLGDKSPSHLISLADGARRKIQHLQADDAGGLRPGKQRNGISGGAAKLPTRSDRADRSEERDDADPNTIKHEAGMCYLRGLCYAKQNAFDRAKECYKDAVRIDVLCFEAFDQLMKNSLMSPGEEWAFLETLNFDNIASGEGDGQTAADFARNLYTTRLSKYGRPEDFNAALDTLSTHYHLSDNADVLLARAESFFTASRYQEALLTTSRIRERDPYNFTCIPLHLALLHQLEMTNALFALAHDLADTHPEVPCTWLAVGTYYLTINRIPEARSYFSKSSLMDPHFGPAWIGFAHTFAAEGEHDQAVAAYSTAARLFQGTHLPQMFLGMQELALGNLPVAREYLTAAYGLSERDPQLINEIGVVAYQEGDFDSAARHFLLALTIADENRTPPNRNASIRINLAHAFRKAERWQDALDQFDEVIRSGMRECAIYASKGLVLLEMDQAFDATVVLHEALAISPQDPIASDLLNKALTQLENE